jgi:hypothetical protein
MECEIVLQAALQKVKRTSSSALEAIQEALSGSKPEIRQKVMELFQQALIRPEINMGDLFQESILEHAIRQSQKERLISQRQMSIKFQPDKVVKQGEMVEDMNNLSNTIASRRKQYIVGDMFETVATLGLKETDNNRKAICKYQFTRKIGKNGTMDLPASTPVRYVGVKTVYEGQANSRRMIFRITKGVKVFLDGNEITLDADIDVAGVDNHVDADNPYNVNAKANEIKRAKKEALRTHIQASKSEAA